jgi:hypothetical protein
MRCDDSDDECIELQPLQPVPVALKTYFSGYFSVGNLRLRLSSVDPWRSSSAPSKETTGQVGTAHYTGLIGFSQRQTQGEHDVFHTTETQTRQNSLISKLTSHKDEKFKDEKAPQPQKSYIKSHVVATSSSRLVDFHIVVGQRHMVQIVVNIKGCRSQQTPMKLHTNEKDKVDVT